MTPETVLDFFHRVSARKRSLSAVTIDQYSSFLRIIENAMGRQVLIDELTETMIRQCTEWMIKQKYTLSYQRVCRDAAAKVLCDYAEQTLRQSVSENPSPEWPLLLFLRDVYEVERNIKPCTARRYDKSIRTFGEFVGHPVRLNELNDNLASRWVKWLGDGGARPKTVHGLRRDVLTVWRRAAKMKLCQPPGDDIRQVKIPRPIPDAWSVEELSSIVNACQRISGFLSNGLPRSRYFRCLIEVTYETGLRRSDVLQLNVSDFNENWMISTIQDKTLDGHVCSVSAETGKQFMWLADRLKECGDKHWSQPLRYPGNMRRCYAVLTRIRKLAGITSRGALQKLRRTGATYVESQYPGAAMRFLGHRTPGLAYKHYVDRTKLGPPPRPPALVLSLSSVEQKGGTP